MNWPLKTLAEVCSPVTKMDPIDTGRNSVQYVDIGVVDGVHHALGEVEWVESAKAPSRCRQVVRSGDTVFSTVRPYLEKIAYIPDRLNGEFASTGFCVLRPNAEVEPRFLFHYATSRGLLDQVLPRQKGVSYPAVLDREVRACHVPVPPLAEQRRIVAILEEHLSDLDDGARSVEAGQSRCTALFASLVASEMARIEGHEVALGELSSGVKNGIFVSRAKAEPDGVAILRIGAVRPMRLDLSDLRYSSLPHDELAAGDALLRPGDLVFTRYNGNPRFVGACALVPEGVSPLTWPDKLIRVRLRDEVADPTYVGYACSFGRGRRAIEDKLKTSAGQVGISGRELRSVRILVPDRATQREIGQRLRARSLEVDRAKDALATASRRSDSLRRALLAAAFSGRLSGHGSDTDVTEELAEEESA